MQQRSIAEYAYHNCEFSAAIHHLSPSELDESSAVTLIKSLCELDKSKEASEKAAAFLSQYNSSGIINYYRGMSEYLSGNTSESIQLSFSKAEEQGYPGGKLGLGFLHFSEGEFEPAIDIMQSAIIEDPELLHIRELMLFQINITIGDVNCASEHLRESNRILINWPSLVRSYWGHICSARLMRQQGNFEGAMTLLSHLTEQLHPSRTPRLVRNINTAKNLARTGDSNTNVIIPSEDVRINHKSMRTITTKPVLNSLYQYLRNRNIEGASKDQIVRKVWDEPYNPIRHDDRIYKTIGRLRKLLGDDLQSPQLLTLKGKNYVLAINSDSKNLSTGAG